MKKDKTPKNEPETKTKPDLNKKTEPSKPKDKPEATKPQAKETKPIEKPKEKPDASKPIEKPESPHPTKSLNISTDDKLNKSSASIQAAPKKPERLKLPDEEILQKEELTIKPKQLPSHFNQCILDSKLDVLEKSAKSGQEITAVSLDLTNTYQPNNS